MANMLYNGVELPDINEVWTDKETYPYAFISGGADFGYSLTCTKAQPIHYGDGEVEIRNTATVVYLCVFLPGETEWMEFGEEVFDGTGSYIVASGTAPMVWTNTDILNTDNTVYLAASDPVPVGGSHITTSSGNGFALYNGVKLPNINDYGGSFIYKVDLSSVTPNAVVYQLIGTVNGVITNYVYTNNQSLADENGIPSATETWTEFINLVGVYPSFATAFWSIIESSEVYSDPLPLDGYTVIEWDGDTTGLVNPAGTGLYRVSDFLNKPASVYCVFKVSSSDDFLVNSHIVENSQLGAAGWGMGEKPSYPSFAAITCAAPDNTVGAESGLYFYKNNAGSRTYLLAYPASSEPTYDRTAFLSGMAMGLCGKGNPTSDMTVSGSGGGASVNMLYNGVELPALPEYDQAKYPYAAIEYINDQGLSGAYLYCTNIPLYYDPTHINSDTAKYHFGDKLASYSQWGFISNEETLSAFAAMMGVSADTLLAMGYGVGFWFHMYDANELGNIGDSNVIWSSYDIVDFVDNTVYLVASTPVPADGTNTIYSFAKGYKVGAALRRKRVIPEVKETATMLYNGVELPNLNKVWTDKAAYPYAVIFRFANGTEYMAIASTQPFAISPSYFLTVSADASAWVYTYKTLPGNPNEFTPWLDMDEPIPLGAGADILYGMNEINMSWGWTNHDVLLPNGSVYMEASEPIPVGGGNE